MDVPGGGLTISAWIKADNLANCGSSDCRIISKATGIQEQDHYWMISTIHSGGTKLRLRLKTDDGITSTLVANQGNIGNGVWTHVAATFDGNVMKLYKDGQSVGSSGKSGNLAVNTGVAAWIGNNPPQATNRPFDGMIDEVAIWDRSLSDQEISDLYTSQTQISCAGCIHRADENCDDKVEMEEMIRFLDRWYAPGTDIEMKELMEAIELFNTGESISGLLG
jgi:hypothetical protein